MVKVRIWPLNGWTSVLQAGSNPVMSNRGFLWKKSCVFKLNLKRKRKELPMPLKEVLLSAQSLLREDTCSRVISPNFKCLQGSWLPERAPVSQPTLHSLNRENGSFQDTMQLTYFSTCFRMRWISPSSACLFLSVDYKGSLADIPLAR